MEKTKDSKLKSILKHQEIIVILLIILISIFLTFRRPDSFPTVLNIFNVLKQASQYGVLAIGMGLVIIRYVIELLGFICGEIAPFENIGKGGVE